MNGPISELVRIRCILCNSNSDKAVASHNGYRVARCDDCGFIFVNPRPTEESLAHIYSDPEQNPFASEAYEPLEYELPVLTKIMTEVSKYVPGGKLFEVGCGRGDLMSVAQTFGFSVEGCDIFGDAKPDLKDATFHEGPLRTAGLPANCYDLVVIRNTLEHLFDPKSELEEIRRIVKPEGYVYLKVPNVLFERGLLCWLVSGQVQEYDAPYHLNHFSARTLKTLLKRINFEFVDWYIEQPTLRPGLKSNLLRQAGYQVTKIIRLLAGKRFFPKVVLSAIVQKTGD